mmetsp:Transcript_51740/g.124870  ORF Transcript_51740/g.124870 Transcript_51740/m.124870 type:complete len:119 (-) Transcript_51740:252-608(-)
MKFSSCITIAALVGSASAFAPSTSSQHKTTAALQAVDFSKEIGVQAPLGLWDPPGVLEGKSQAQFDRLRAQEIKHGRVAMLAVVGYLVTYVSFLSFRNHSHVNSQWSQLKAMYNTMDS